MTENNLWAIRLSLKPSQHYKRSLIQSKKKKENQLINDMKSIKFTM